jgi:multiple sugar transport system permease protein
MARVWPARAPARLRGWAGTMEVFKQERGFALLMVAPAFVVLVLTTTFPLVYLIYNSLFTINLSMPFLDGFAGLSNYANLLGDARFWHALKLTAIYTTVTVTLQVVIGLALALLVLAIPRGQWLFRVAAILPMVLAPVVVGLIWRSLMLTPKTGIVDLTAIALGFGSFNWLGDPTMALVSVIAVHTWQWTPFAFLVFLASLASVPPDLYEAARIDRASTIRRFLHITLPLIRPAIVIVVILRLIIALSAFDAILALTGGGPGTATEILNLYAYRAAFIELNFGYGSALATTLLVITLVISGFFFRLRSPR